MSKKENKIKGNFGENLACTFLNKLGYTILERNFSCAYGELDIIASLNKCIIFIEVKTRCQSNFGMPVEAVDKYKKYHIYHAAKYYLYKHKMLEAPIQFDVIEVYLYRQ